MSNNKRRSTTPARLAIHEKEVLALELRAAGQPYHVISEQCGWKTPSAACRAVKRLMAEQVREPAEHLREIEVIRLDKLLSYLWRDAQQGRWLAIDRILKIMERKAALLGLDAPQKRIVEHVTPEAFRSLLESLEAENAELSAKLEKAGSSINVDLDAMDRQVAAELEMETGPRLEEDELRDDDVVDADVIEEADVVGAGSANSQE